MMANHRLLAWTPFDPTHHAHTKHTPCTQCMHMKDIAANQLLGLPTTNENTSFVFKFGTMSYALNFGKYRMIKACHPNGHCLYVH